ncbi:aldehyde dehydrogenase [uncultured Microbacterium sp.]|uniref:aldehyde dehydrogenase n=1 Tax=uncultured Microbacterium sp. TaxID=191216 RepID=UPI0035CC1629
MTLTTSDIPTYELFIDGKWQSPTSGEYYETLNPYTGRPWARVPESDADDVDAAVTAATRALEGPWGQATGFERATLMRRLAGILERDADALAEIETRGNGKLIRETSAQAKALSQWLYYFAGVADKLEGEVIPSDRKNFMIYTRHEPVGVVAAIVPWNSPLSLLMWKLAPLLAAGCTVVVKPSPYTPVSALALAERVREAGFPDGVFNVITANGADAAKALVAHRGVNQVAFTGSPQVGASIAQSAASHFARTLLELGGKSAQIVFADADIEGAVNGVISGIFAASGQTCVAGSRLVIHKDIRDAFVRRLTERAQEIVLGDPLSFETEMGPLANAAQLQTTQGFVQRAVEDGANVVTGGRVDDALGGLFYRPTILADVTNDMEIAQKEVFGPVLAVLDFEHEHEAIAIANGTDFALAAGVWTNDMRTGHRVAHAVRAGNVWINSYRVVAPNVPFGGSGASGWGRESGIDAVKEYTVTKAIWVELSGETRDPFRIG